MTLYILKFNVQFLSTYTLSYVETASPVLSFACGTLMKSKEEFAALFESHHVAIFRYIYAISNFPEDIVEELTADVFLKAWNRRETFNGNTTDAGKWLFTIARNLVIDTSRKKVAPTSPPPLDLSRTTEEVVINHQDYEVVRNLLVRLPPRQRDIITMRYILNWKLQEISEALNIKENTVSKTLKRALDKLSEWYSQEMG